MGNASLRNITDSFQDVRLARLASRKQAGEFMPRDRREPRVVLQEGCDPEDPKGIAGEFVPGRSGKRFSLSHFYRMPVPDLWAELIFGTAAEVMQMMRNLPSKVQIIQPGAPVEAKPAHPETDEMAVALRAAQGQPPGAAS